MGRVVGIRQSPLSGGKNYPERDTVLKPQPPVLKNPLVAVDAFGKKRERCVVCGHWIRIIWKNDITEHKECVTHFLCKEEKVTKLLLHMEHKEYTQHKSNPEHWKC